MNDQPASKRDLAELEARMDAKLDAKLGTFKHEILEKVQEMVRDAQTEILRGFQVFAKANEIRMRRLETSDAGLNERVANVEARLLQVEEKLILRPPSF